MRVFVFQKMQLQNEIAKSNKKRITIVLLRQPVADQYLNKGNFRNGRSWGKPAVGEQGSDSTTCCAICSERCRKSAGTARAHGSLLGWSPSSLIPGWPSGHFRSIASILVEGEVKEPAPSTGWSLLSESNKNSFNTCGVGVQGDRLKRSSVHQRTLPEGRTSRSRKSLRGELIWQQEADNTDIPAKSGHAALHSVVPSSSLPHDISTINHQNSHTTAASEENFGFLPSDGVLLLLIWAEQRNTVLPSQKPECFFFKDVYSNSSQFVAHFLQIRLFLI